MLELLRELCALRGTSGDEGRVREAILAKIEGHCDCRVDALGNIIAFKKGQRAPKNRLQLSAHMDEVGFIVTHIGEDGLLRFAAVGGVEPAVTIGKQVLVGDRGLPGVIGLKPVHLLEGDEKDTLPKTEAMAIDIGAKDKSEAEEWARPGDRVTFESAFTPFGDGLLQGRALDDRAGCAMLIALIRGDLLYDCTFTFTVQEENGCVGAKTAAWAVEPDIAVAIETTTAGDIAGAPAEKQFCRLGAGPVLSFMDRGTVYSPALYSAAAAEAERLGIRWQPKEGVAGGNESRSLQAARAGAKVLAVSLPCRYLHSPACVLNLCDIEETLRLLQALVVRFAEL